MEPKIKPLTEAHLAALEKRGITAETAERLGWTSFAGRKGLWVSMPYFRRGNAVNHKYRRIEKDPSGDNFQQDKGGEQCFYNLQALEDIEVLPPDEQRSVEVVITEGEMDCAIALQIGFLAVSVPGGAPSVASDGLPSLKWAFLEDFPKWAIAVLAVDDDPPGQILRQELALRLGWHRCKWVKYPKGCKDLNEVFVKYGAKGVNMVLKDKASFMNSGGLFLMSELPAQPEIEALGCNIGNVSEMIKLRLGDVSVFTGIPSMGKTLFVNCMACNMAQTYGWNVCFGSFEQSPRGDHLRYLRTFYLQQPRKDNFGNVLWTAPRVAEADSWIDRHFTFIVPDVNTDEMVTLKWVLARVRAAIIQHGAKLIIIDPWNELDHDRPNGMSLTEYTGYAIKEFKRLAKQYMVHVTIVAHPAKMERGRDGTYAVPSLYDISDSSHWANKSDIGVIIHRLEGESEGKFATLVRVAKVRYWGVIGRTGDRFLEYLPERGIYLDAPDFKPKKPRDPSKPQTPREDKKTADKPSQTSLPYKDSNL